MAKQIIRLTESDIHKIVKQTINKIINESDTGNFNDFYEGDDPYVSLQSMLKGQPCSPEWMKSANKIMFDLGRKIANDQYDMNKADKVYWDILNIADKTFEKMGYSRGFYQDFHNKLNRAWELGMKNMPIHDGLYN